MLVKLLKGRSSDWDLYLPEVTYAINTRFHHTTKCSPFEILFGCKPRLPGEPRVPLLLDYISNEQLKELQSSRISTTVALREDVKRLRVEAANKDKEYYDKKLLQENSRTITIKEGMPVLLKNPPITKTFTPLFSGPYRIHAVKGNGLFQLQDLNGNIKRELVHRDRIVPAKMKDGPVNLNDWYFYYQKDMPLGIARPEDRQVYEEMENLRC